ncbi:hypothetical protein [Rheinheimera metallidurans]|uniref:hypothetical protein n=1 Tax=Rheinheimera metallidurans TaxID=2925781 RepID=UPI003003974D
MEKPTVSNADNSAFSRGVDAASGSMHRAIDGAADAASPAIKTMSASAHNTVDKMASGVNYAADALATKGTQLHHLQQQLAESTRGQVRSHPLITLGIAAAGGALLSIWLTRSLVGRNTN